MRKAKNNQTLCEQHLYNIMVSKNILRWNLEELKSKFQRMTKIYSLKFIAPNYFNIGRGQDSFRYFAKKFPNPLFLTYIM